MEKKAKIGILILIGIIGISIVIWSPWTAEGEEGQVEGYYFREVEGRDYVYIEFTDATVGPFTQEELEMLVTKAVNEIEDDYPQFEEVWPPNNFEDIVLNQNPLRFRLRYREK
ncbi:hypothetical protein AKJ51_00345 [candidate division MSBL1 archaeon SCGC-AAA382A20]|uniref:Uncharacterized protein n=1 Tax=candidate division MSBL1 archaeon SCGC-AAA382A20 TaxID=1698280 RepID=A0A133VMP7_9EURY|nr:hypothetical protein AKJ51_00345 [candidate division MSBL1 archaeon SCGC-AAA382A20]